MHILITLRNKHKAETTNSQDSMQFVVDFAIVYQVTIGSIASQIREGIMSCSSATITMILEETNCEAEEIQPALSSHFTLAHL